MVSIPIHRDTPDQRQYLDTPEGVRAMLFDNYARILPEEAKYTRLPGIAGAWLVMLPSGVMFAYLAGYPAESGKMRAFNGARYTRAHRFLSAEGPFVLGEGVVEPPEKGGFDVILLDAGPRWVGVTRALRKYWYSQRGDWLSVPPVSKIVPMVKSAGPDCKVREGVSAEEAERLKQQLEAVGAKVEVR